ERFPDSHLRSGRAGQSLVSRQLFGWHGSSVNPGPHYRVKIKILGACMAGRRTHQTSAPPGRRQSGSGRCDPRTSHLVTAIIRDPTFGSSVLRLRFAAPIASSTIHGGVLSVVALPSKTPPPRGTLPPAADPVWSHIVSDNSGASVETPRAV